jgi:hypothetical protein
MSSAISPGGSAGKPQRFATTKWSVALATGQPDTFGSDAAFAAFRLSRGRDFWLTYVHGKIGRAILT